MRQWTRHVRSLDTQSGPPKPLTGMLPESCPLKKPAYGTLPGA